ncbi:hypothetical protein WPS_10640 [Vulcanimicrobium alpinum]|uniref:DUF1440 domain-containing protein n=1 Tax=Vulcanimicrobium alpinum TaxID=3016050 RepID=A0AAN2C9A7_UNVUL|nr:hypothetical protein [Vulcanimicrobium alpinum]BDE05788.1 hypothetical protein WPS_10640 [Vulcanimicrobium alpinum]
MAAATLDGGLVAGVLDASFAVVAYVFVLHAFSLVGVLQYIASGLLGVAAFKGGLATAALGVAVHFFFAFLYAGLYAAAARRFPILIGHAIIAGLSYGIAVWIFMDLIVLPRTGVPQFPFNPALFAAFLVDHAVFVGLPIALATRRRLAA